MNSLFLLILLFCCNGGGSAGCPSGHNHRPWNTGRRQNNGNDQKSCHHDHQQNLFCDNGQTRKNECTEGNSNRNAGFCREGSQRSNHSCNGTNSIGSRLDHHRESCDSCSLPPISRTPFPYPDHERTCGCEESN